MHSMIYLFEHLMICKVLVDKPGGKYLQWIALCHPQLLLFLRSIIRTLNVAYVVPMIAIRIAEHESRPLTASRSFNKLLCCEINFPYVLPINLFGVYTESFRSRTHLSRRRL